MEDNAKVSMAVIFGAGGLILVAALAFLMYRGLTCESGAEPGNATLAATKAGNQTTEQLQRLRQELQSSAASLERAHQELEASRSQEAAMKGNLTKQLQELSDLQQQVFNLSSENQRLQEDLLSWRKNLSSTSEELREARSAQEELQRQNKEYEERVQRMESLLHSGSDRPKSAFLFGAEMVTVLLSIIVWVY
ncbi:tropomyosin isoforms a/b/d/f-like [Pleurodeles waltl]|uniref:tropomyosin isoforms a/b/d/f-like n=1 Tax=Pleurodeles waltl TaxID=8319 RepID=UPI0037097FEB